MMCRAGNGVNICFNHMEWRNDALCIYFAHMKNDQSGDRPRDPRHVYANPIIPEICPVLALGVYLICFPIEKENLFLFPGNSQYDRYRKVLGRICENEAKAELESRGIKSKDIGTHSVRKGASSFCSSGSTACPPSVAVNLRAGWAMGGVQDRYFRYEAAGDQYVGRTVSGLPLMQPQFAILPPCFKELTDLVDEVLIECFPNLPSSMKLVGEFCLASIIYDQSFIAQNFHEIHSLYFSSLFRNAARFSQMQDMVECRMPTINDQITATGIPPHVKSRTKVTDVQSSK